MGFGFKIDVYNQTGAESKLIKSLVVSHDQTKTETAIDLGFSATTCRYYQSPTSAEILGKGSTLFFTCSLDGSLFGVRHMCFQNSSLNPAVTTVFSLLGQEPRKPAETIIPMPRWLDIHLSCKNNIPVLKQTP